MNTEEMKRLKKELREMDVIDNFLFTEIMSDEENGKEACRLILSRVLGREIGEYGGSSYMWMVIFRIMPKNMK